MIRAYIFIRPLFSNAAKILDILQYCYFKIHETHFLDFVDAEILQHFATHYFENPRATLPR